VALAFNRYLQYSVLACSRGSCNALHRSYMLAQRELCRLSLWKCVHTHANLAGPLQLV
jgi:hypothetical protein